jgi:hypothetical protein
LSDCDQASFEGPAIERPSWIGEVSQIASRALEIAGQFLFAEQERLFGGLHTQMLNRSCTAASAQGASLL